MEQCWDLCEAVCSVAREEMDSISDEGLMFLLRNQADPQHGNELFAELYRRYHPRVLSWCRRLTRNREGSNDLAQEVFLRAFRYMHTFRGDSSLSTWLYVITRNYCMNALKKCGRDPVDGADLVSPGVAGSDGTETYKNLATTQSFAAMWQLIHKTLTPLEARVMALHYGHGLPLALIGRELMLSNRSGAKAYIVNARRKLNAVLRGRRTKCRQVDSRLKEMPPAIAA
jgi:RNA polymerase sigma-70 factor (ECF subfamily)